MKKILILTLAMTLSFGVVSAARAGTVYFDYLTTGSSDLLAVNYLADRLGYERISFDNTQFTLGADIQLNDSKFGIELSSGKVDYNGVDFNTNSFKFTVGSKIINDDNLQLDLTAGFYSKAIDYKGFILISDYTLKSFIIGVDSRINFNKLMWLDSKLNYGIAPKAEISKNGSSSSGNIDSLLIVNLKFNYLLTKELGFSTGYLLESFDIGKNYKDKFTGLTIGINYNF